MSNLLVIIMTLTNFRFSKDYRHGITLYHKAVYSAVDCIGCNIKADSLTANYHQQLEFADMFESSTRELLKKPKALIRALNS